MYIVKTMFVDLQDHNHKYMPGDAYPREGYTPSESRIEELASSANKKGVELISVVKGAVPEADRHESESVAKRVAVQLADKKPAGESDKKTDEKSGDPKTTPHVKHGGGK